MNASFGSFFSFRGRLSLAGFWQASLLTGAAFGIAFTALNATFGYGSTLVLYPPFFWAMGAAAVKRMHDRNLSPWWLLTALIPLLGPLWLMGETGLRKGTSGDNPHGADPLASRLDYMTVE